MKFKVNRKAFLNLVQSIAPGVSNKSPVSILEFFKMEAVDGRVELSATNMEITLKGFREAEVERNGLAIIKANILQSIVYNASSDDVYLETTGSKIRISAGKSVFNVNFADPSQFPPIHQYSDFKFSKVEKGLLDKVDRVAFAASKDEHRYNLRSVYVQPTEMAATDGHRLAILRHSIPLDKPVLIPSEAFGSLRKAFSHSDVEELSVCRDENNLHFHSGQVAASLRLLNAKFVDYARVLPKDPHKDMVVQRDHLKGALKLVTLVSDKINHVRFDLKDGILKLQTRSEEVGEAKDEVEAQHKEPAEFALFAAESWNLPKLSSKARSVLNLLVPAIEIAT